MQVEEIKAMVESHIAGSNVEVSIDGSHIQLVVVSDQFEGLSRLKKQQLVYGALADKIADGTLHAVNMQTLTPEEAAAR
ncbi:BolA family protein [Biformimicrobium ophioploci]|uniref:BolA family iron metabolism protein IbaG n=1 Tax=Biformimicrobium ophioploci TaxID=3036711 RepID=A0ABQ6LX62_9GAMM|nr:BolA/IbaG family iron-sulfur metabolism protein [Microbulbifer sp. NKW57]GMG86607.1 BolA family iron metabolism protein IbaG [Microbulbifer sp. NKW57]